MIHSEFSAKFKGTEFFAQYWDCIDVKAVVLLVHGMGEHSSRYKDFVIPNLLENNFAVVAFDHFGHGRTKGKRGVCPSYDAVLDSVTVFLEKAKELFPDKPVFLYGHSMGGNVVVNYMLQKNPDVKGAICTSPFLRLAFNPSKIKLKLAEILLKIAPNYALSSGLDATAVSRIKEEVEKYKNDPLNHGKVSANFSVPFIEAGEWAIKNIFKLNKPMLLLHGTADRLTSVKASEEIAKKSDKIKFKTYPKAYHELHNDLCRDEFMKDVIDWLLSKL